jgi:transcriptional regulator with XRE-family HTH domain
MREQLGIGTDAFSREMGYTRAYQSQIENNFMKSVSLRLALQLMELFEHHGATITDSV